MEFKGYNGNPNLKKVNTKIEWTPDLVKEYIKCKEDIIYFVETYMKIVHVDKGLINFKLYSYQRQMLKDMQEHRFNAFCLSRQSGKSDRKSTRLNSSHIPLSRMPSSA